MDDLAMKSCITLEEVKDRIVLEQFLGASHLARECHVVSQISRREGIAVYEGEWWKAQEDISVA